MTQRYSRTFNDRLCHRVLDHAGDEFYAIRYFPCIGYGNKLVTSHWTFNLDYTDFPDTPIAQQLNRHMFGILPVNPSPGTGLDYILAGENVQPYFLWGHLDYTSTTAFVWTERIYWNYLTYAQWITTSTKYHPPMWGGVSYYDTGNPNWLFRQLDLSDSVANPEIFNPAFDPIDWDAQNLNYFGVRAYDTAAQQDQFLNNIKTVGSMTYTRVDDLYTEELKYEIDFYQSHYVRWQTPSGASATGGFFLFGRGARNGDKVYWIGYKLYFRHAGWLTIDSDSLGGPVLDDTKDTWEWRGEYYLDRVTTGNRAGYETVEKYAQVFPIIRPPFLIAVAGRKAVESIVYRLNQLDPQRFSHWTFSSGSQHDPRFMPTYQPIVIEEEE